MTAIDLSNYSFRAIIFDCDGTLASTAPVHYAALAGAISTSGSAMPEAWYYDRVGLSRGELLDAFQTEFGITLDFDSVADTSTRLFRDNIGAVREITIVAAVARHYAGLVPMAVASGGQRVIVEATLDAIGLRRLFDTVVTVEDVSRGKPSPELFLEAARRLEMQPSDCLVFEDSPEGLDAARHASMQAIDVRPLILASLELGSGR